jgi:hypothetical protein
MEAFHQYDPGKIILSLGASPSPISGYAKGTFIEVERDANAFEKSVGSDGEVTRIRNRNRAGSIHIKLQQGSASNAYLTSLALEDELTGKGVVPLLVTDMSGALPNNSSAGATKAWIRKQPKLTFGGEAEEVRDWIIDCASMAQFTGGN